MRNPATLDLRSLALLRIGTAGLLIYDLLDRVRDLTNYYTDIGFLPRALVVEKYWNPSWWSVHLYSGQPAGAALLFALHGCAAIALLVGWRTRAASWACYLLTLSLQNRNPLVLDSGDRLFLLVLFWGLFLPWEARGSVDARHRPKLRPDACSVVCAGGAGYLLQIAQVYFVAAFWKLHPVWVTERTALDRTLEITPFTKPLGVLLMSHPNLMAALTLGTVIVEWSAPILILTGNNAARLCGVVALVGLHAGIFATMDLEFFPLVAIVSLLGCLPSSIWGGPPAAEALEGPGVRWAYHPLTLALATLAIFGTVCWNSAILLNAGKPLTDKTFEGSRWVSVVSAFRLVQFWDLFAPVPREVSSRYFVEAHLENGETLDLLRGGQALAATKVDYPYREFKNQHERNYLSALEWSVDKAIVLRYLRRQAVIWDEAHPDRKVLWTRLISVRTESRYVDPERLPKVFEIAWAISPRTLWQGPLQMPYGERLPFAVPIPAAHP